MAKILKVRTVHDYNAYLGQPDKHPLVSVIDYDDVSPIRHSLNDYSVYGLFLRDDNLVDLKYGSGRYDYDESTLLCVSPGQIGGKEDNGERCHIKGWALLFHPDLISGTPLEKKMKTFTFFSYNVNEALHTTPSERETLIDCLRLIQRELDNGDASYRDSLIVSLIDVVLQYCMRFYERQFNARRKENNDVLARFELFLNDYYDTGRQLTEGIPTVRECASGVCMSTNYFADVVKKLTGETASEHIRRFVVRRAKNLLIGGEAINQVAYDLGFDYPQHLSRMFKKQEGCTPSDYVRRSRG